MNDRFEWVQILSVTATPTFSFSLERLKRGQGLFDSHPNPCIDLCNKSFKAVLGGQKKSSAFSQTPATLSAFHSFPNITSVKDGGGKWKTVKME